MWNEPTEEELERIRPMMSSRAFNNPLDTIIYEHFFLGGSDWYASEYDPEYRLFFGYTILNADYQMGEWGYDSKGFALLRLGVPLKTRFTSVIIINGLFS